MSLSRITRNAVLGVPSKTYKLYTSNTTRRALHAQVYGGFSQQPMQQVCVVPQRWYSSSKAPADTDAEEDKPDGSKQHTEDDPAESGAESKANEPAEPEHVDEAALKIKELQDENQGLHDKLLRTYAEMENVRTIAQRDVQNAHNYSVQKIAKNLLDVADNLTRAIDSVSVDDLDDESNAQLRVLLEGVQMTEKQLQKTFEQHGITQFGAVGDEFDPHAHEAMFEYQDPNQKAGTIGQVIKVGYNIKDRVLRHAQVGTIKS